MGFNGPMQVNKDDVTEHTRQAYTDLVACQVKTLSFVAYILARYQVQFQLDMWAALVWVVCGSL